ncbi:unnamed protein product [Prorocentrum cordatum]|uniref:25S rRNA (uridine-N(3))-methyltransferase BMT5-like domain-containing protein n=1 Tax=Prorocentrum cordatum TaxID=2364126 RepID=A0ABN9UHU9_9DINO|nr:unnamed protein product [Polarella glacialis]
MKRARRLRLLTVGDGDLSFSLALQRCFGDGVAVAASTYLSRDELSRRYRSTHRALRELADAGAEVLHGVDACRLEEQLEGLVSEPDVVLFSSNSEHARQHCALLAHFLAAARKVLPLGGQVHVTLCGEQPRTWRLEEAAGRAGLTLLQSREPQSIDAFLAGDLPQRLPAPAPARPGHGARRKWRSGALGCAHWASPYGYEFRRHEGECSMSVGRSLAFAFVAAAPPASVQRPPGRDGAWCPTCLQSFSSEAALARHLLAPATPLELAAARRACVHCGRAFLSARALRQHAEAAACGHGAACARRTVSHAEAAVGQEHAGARLVAFARAAFPEALPSKPAARRAIAAGEVLLNGEAVEETRILRAGDVVALRRGPAGRLPEAAAGAAARVRLVAGASGAGGPCSEGAAVVWKPAGMRSLGHHPTTLQSALALLLPAADGPLPLTGSRSGARGSRWSGRAPRPASGSSGRCWTAAWSTRFGRRCTGARARPESGGRCSCQRSLPRTDHTRGGGARHRGRLHRQRQKTRRTAEARAQAADATPPGACSPRRRRRSSERRPAGCKTRVEQIGTTEEERIGTKTDSSRCPF